MLICFYEMNGWLMLKYICMQLCMWLCAVISYITRNARTLDIRIKIF